MMFGPVVSIVCFSWPPEKFELLLAFSVSQPMKTHVHCLCSFWLYFGIDDCFGHGVVGLDGRCRLFVSHFLEYDSDVNRLSSHDV